MRIDENRLELTRVLHALLVDYWHDVDTNWGRNAPDYYTEDARFVGSAAAYEGREKIRAFYQWRGESRRPDGRALGAELRKRSSTAARTRQPAIGS